MLNNRLFLRNLYSPLCVRFLVLGFLVFLTACSTLPINKKHKPGAFPPPPQKTFDIVLVLGGGGVKGLAHVGVLEELEARGLRPELIIGCSAGALVGALYADYPSAKALHEKLIQARRIDFLSNDYLPVSRFGYSDHSYMRRYLKKHITSKTFDQLTIPLLVVATHVGTGELIELHEGNLSTAVMASSAFPGAYEPVKYRGAYLFDGGAASVIPVLSAKQFKPKVIIAVDISEGLSDDEPTSLFGLLKRAVEISYMHMSKNALKYADVVIQMNFKNIGVFDDTRKDELYLTGRLRAKQSIARIKAALAKKGLSYRMNR